MRHSDSRLTFELYVQATSEADRGAADTVGRQFSAAIGEGEGAKIAPNQAIFRVAKTASLLCNTLTRTFSGRLFEPGTSASRTWIRRNSAMLG